MRCSITGAATAALLFLTSSAQADTIYVDANLETGANDGSSWNNAFRGLLGLQNALGASSSGDQVWVAAGTYIPADATPRTASFHLRTGVEIYGGFAGGENDLADRDPVVNVVILSGDLAQDDEGGSTFENSYHVVQGGNANNTGLLSGVTITAGFSNGAGTNNRGGGLYIVTNDAPRIEDTIVRDNRCTFGGGACYISNANPSFSRVVFESNIGGQFGGAFDIFSSGVGSAVDFNSCQFIDNTASRAGGVEVFGSNAIATFVNCLFRENHASSNGGAVWTGSSGRVEIYNSTVVNNNANGNTGGLYLPGLQSLVRNTIVWHNTDNDGNQSQILGPANVQFCNVEDGWAGAGSDNIDAEPIFENLEDGNLNLADGSPGIDAGSNALVPAGTETDLEGGPRRVDDPLVADTGSGEAPVVDMGALERDIPCPGDTDGNGEVNLGDLLDVLGSWGPCKDCPADFDGDGVVDLQDLLVLLGAWGLCP